MLGTLEPRFAVRVRFTFLGIRGYDCTTQSKASPNLHTLICSATPATYITMAMPPAVELCWQEAEAQRLSWSRCSIFQEELTPYGNHRQLKLQDYSALSSFLT